MALGTAATVVVAAVVAGAVGAGTVFLVGQPSPAPGSAPPPADGTVALLAQLDRQEKEIAALRARVDEAAQADRGSHPVALSWPGVPTGTVTSDKEVQFFDPATLKPSDPNGAPPTADLASISPEERAKYEAVYKSMREKEQEEAKKARLAAYETGLRARLDRLPAELGLTPEQKDAAVKILVARGEKLRAVFEESRTAGGADAYRAAQEKAVEIRKEATDALAQALTAEQAKAVEDSLNRGGPGNRNRMDGNGRRTPRNAGGTPGAGNPPR